MIFVHANKNDDEVEEEGAEVSIDESMLDEISDTSSDVDETEGFGHLKEADEKEEKEKKEKKEEEDDEEEEEEGSLEEDAEDVDYDSFDDEDHL